MRRQIRITQCLVAVLAALVLGAITALAATPSLISIQGKLTDNAGNPLAPGVKSFVFRIFNASTLGTQIWPAAGGEAQNISTNSLGLWTGQLGAVNSLTDVVFADTARWLEITVNGELLSPRVRLVTGAYAMRVATIDGASSGHISGTLYVNGGVIWGGDAIAPYSRSDVDASGLFVEHVGTSNANDNMRIQASKSGDATNYSQFIIDPSNGFSFAELGTANGNVGIGTATPDAELDVIGDVHISSELRVGAFPDGKSELMLVQNTNANWGTVFRVANNSGATLFRVDSDGDVFVTGNLSKGGGSFKIDHPLDPANQTLSHSFVESPDMMNIYNGIAALDANGEAVVVLPEWFGALNREYRYQLTAVCAPGPNLYIAQRITGNQFRIAGGTGGMEVSWQVTGIRQDAYANAHRIPVEEVKPENERGTYIHPELFSQPGEEGIEWARHPEMMKQMKDEREKAKVENERE